MTIPKPIPSSDNTATDRGDCATVQALGVVEPVGRHRQLAVTGGLLLAAGVTLSAANLRPAVTSLASVLGDVRAGLGVSAGWTSLLTAVPVLCFGAAAFAAPWVGRRFGLKRAVASALALLTLGLLLRVVDGPFVVLGGTFVACAGIAVCNVLIPVVVKDSFPTRIGLITGIYTAAMAAGAGLGAALTPPLEALLGSWRGAVGAWALLSAAALVLWLAGARKGVTGRVARTPAGRSLLHSPLAWVMTVFFGLQALLAYTIMGWLPAILGDADVDRTTAGFLLAITVVLGVPVSLVVPPLAARWKSQVGMVLVLGALSLSGVLGLAFAPGSAPALWVLLVGLGMGGMFPLALVMVSLRTVSTSDTARLSAMTQSIGYLIAAAGPFAFGLLRESTGSWTASMIGLAGLVLLLTALGSVAGRNRFV
ncbi:MFS transporter [Umezawaea tangerina]|uniref:MFS transporter n=1 Tax=Umezawaea tangerina TaxID=84725 RepID=UPI002481BB0F|nr:MFS transporter [Umezawaea tangerina]